MPCQNSTLPLYRIQSAFLPRRKYPAVFQIRLHGKAIRLWSVWRHTFTHISIRKTKQGNLKGKSRESPDAMHEVQVVNHLPLQDLSLNGSLKAKYENGGDTIPFPQGWSFPLGPCTPAALSTKQTSCVDNGAGRRETRKGLDTNQGSPSHK